MISIYDIQGNVLMQVPVTPECEHAEELMRTDEVRLFWNAASNTTIPDGAYVIVGGENYYLVEPYNPTQRKENQWRYEPVFISAFYALSKVPFYMYTYEGGDPTGTITAREADWVLTTDAATFMDTLCVAIKNETGLQYTYAVAAGLPASKTITFNSVDQISALNAIANAFETEFWLEKYATPDASGNIGKIHLSFANDGETAKVLTVGTNVNVPSVSDGREGFYNRFVVLGSTRNITQDYQGAGVNSVANKRLTLDPTDYPNGYIDYADGGKPYTKILTFDDIYPVSNLRIKAVLARTRYVLDDNDNPIVIQPGQGSSPDVYDLYNIYYVKLEQYDETTQTWDDFVFNNTDYNADTNPTGMRLPNMPVSIHFESGPLRGREFELKYLDNAIINAKDKADTTTFSCPAGYFEVIKTQEGNYIIPSLTGLVPAVDDQIVLFNIKMPDEYVEGAQARLEAAAFEEIGKNYIKLNADGTAVRDASGNLIRVDKNSYQLTSNPVAFSASNPGLKLASAVTYVNGDYSLSTRVKALVTKLDFGIKQSITIGEEVTKGTIQELKEEAANANQNIDLLDALNSSTQRLLDAYNRTQELIQARQVDNYLQLNSNQATRVELRDQYNYFGPKKGLIFGLNATADSNVHLEVVNVGTEANPVYALHSPLPFYSDTWISAGGVSSGGGSTGTTLAAVWASIMGNSDEYANDKINAYHIPIGSGLSIDGQGNINVTSQGTVTGIKIGSTTYTPASGSTIVDITNGIPTSMAWSAITNTPTNLAGYGITDAKIESGVITLGSNTITPLTTHQTLYDLVIKNSAGTTQITYKPATSGTYSLTLTAAMVGLGNVENTALSTWAGSSNITTLGTISTGTWHGSTIGSSYLPSMYIGRTAVAFSAGQATLLGIDAISNASSSGSSDKSRIVWDSTNNAWHFLGNVYADGFVSAGGVSSGGGTGGIDLAAMWASLQNNDIETTYDNYLIATPHIPDMASTYGYLKSADLSNIEAALSSLQCQVDSVAARDFADEISYASGFIDTFSASTAYIGSIRLGSDPSTAYDVATKIASKQDTISDLSTIRSYSTEGHTAYGWGNHANAGYFLASNFTASNISTTLGSTYVANANYASSAGNADTLDNYHASGLLTSLSSSSGSLSIGIGGATASSISISASTDSDGYNIASNMTKIGSALRSLQAQVDSVAARPFGPDEDLEMSISLLFNSVQAQIDSVSMKIQDFTANGFFDTLSVGAGIYAGSVLATGYITAGSASDMRLKDNIYPMNEEEAKRIIMALSPVTFTWNDKATSLCSEYKGDDWGFVAQQVQPIVPTAIGRFYDYLRLNQEKFIAPLVSVAQDHERRLTEIERRLNS